MQSHTSSVLLIETQCKFAVSRMALLRRTDEWSSAELDTLLFKFWPSRPNPDDLLSLPFTEITRQVVGQHHDRHRRCPSFRGPLYHCLFFTFADSSVASKVAKTFVALIANL